MAMTAATSLLREVADRMREVVPPSSIIARLGGDEFGICVVFEPEYPETVDRIAEDLVEAWRGPFMIADSRTDRHRVDRHSPARI